MSNGDVDNYIFIQSNNDLCNHETVCALSFSLFLSLSIYILHALQDLKRTLSSRFMGEYARKSRICNSCNVEYIRLTKVQ